MFKTGWLSAPDIPFSRDEANRFLPWIVAFMVCLTGLMLAASLSLGALMHRMSGNYLHSFTIQIPHETAETIEAGSILALVSDNDWVAEARQIRHEEMRSLIEPWLGSAEAVDALPLPLLIEVKAKDDAEVDLKALEHRLQSVAPGAEIDDYQQWIDQFTHFSHGIQYSICLLALLVLLTTLAIVILAAKTALRLHQQTVEVLYTIGAQDDYIAEQFQQNAMRVVFKGAFFGTFAAAVLFWSSHGMTAAMESPLLPVFDFTPAHALLFLLLPVLMAMAAFCSTRYAVLALLKRKP